MTKQNYTAIATEIHTTLEGIAIESGSDDAKTKATTEVICLADNIARYFKLDNHNFDYDRFTEACGFHGSNTVDYRN